MIGPDKKWSLSIFGERPLFKRTGLSTDCWKLVIGYLSIGQLTHVWATPEISGTWMQVFRALSYGLFHFPVAYLVVEWPADGFYDISIVLIKYASLGIISVYSFKLSTAAVNGLVSIFQPSMLMPFKSSSAVKILLWSFVIRWLVPVVFLLYLTVIGLRSVWYLRKIPERDGPAEDGGWRHRLCYQAKSRRSDGPLFGLAVKSKSHTAILCMSKPNLGMDDIQLVLIIRTEAGNEVNH
jgi:hypothetical protein